MHKNIDNQTIEGEEKSKPEVIKLGLDLHARQVTECRQLDGSVAASSWKEFQVELPEWIKWQLDHWQQEALESTNPVIATTEAALNANLAIGSFNITLGSILAALITVWGLLSGFKILAFSAGSRRLSSFASRPRRSVCDLYDASLCHPALRVLRCLGRARD